MNHHFSDRWFYHPSRERYAHPDEFNLRFESVSFQSCGRRLHGWFFPAQGPSCGTVIHCHGNAGNITGHFQYVAWMPLLGWNVLCFDYQGFGQSEGRPSREGTIADVTAAIDYVHTREDVDPSRLVLLGQSLGGTVGIVASAGRDDLRGVVIEGAFSAYREAARYVCKRTIVLWPLAPFTALGVVPAGFDPIDHVAHIAPVPTFFVTGTADSVCDPQQTLALHAAAGEPKSLWVIDGGRHAAALTETDGEGQLRIDAFLRECL